jgi:hypothetical protein
MPWCQPFVPGSIVLALSEGWHTLPLDLLCLKDVETASSTLTGTQSGSRYQQSTRTPDLTRMRSIMTMVLITSRAMMTDRLFQPGESSKFGDDDLDKDKLGDVKIEG